MSHSHSLISSQSHTQLNDPTPSALASTSDSPPAPDATTKLAEAIDDFLGDLEKKFKGISDEIITRLDDMAERCDRLEQEMLVRDGSLGEEGEKR